MPHKSVQCAVAASGGAWRLREKVARARARAGSEGVGEDRGSEYRGDEGAAAAAARAAAEMATAMVAAAARVVVTRPVGVRWMVARVIRCIGRAARAFKDLLELVKTAPALVESTYPVHVLLMKGFSTLFLRQREGTCDIGLRTGAGYSEDPFAVAAKLLADETTIQAKPSDFITIPGVTLPGASILLYPSTDKDIWVRDTAKYAELEFVCCNTLENVGKIFPTSCFFHQLRGVVNYVLNDPSCHYHQILARCPICHSLGPRGSSCTHPSRPPFPRQETGIVGYLQGKQADCNMCGHGD